MRNSFLGTPRSETSTRRCASVVALLAAALCACSSPGFKRQAPGTRIYDVHAQRFVTEATLVADLATARYRLLGEVHDNPAHHAIRARLITQIAKRGARPAVVMEQFDLDHDAALRAAQAAGADADRLADAGVLDRKGWRWPLHEPLVAAALAMHLPVRAGNLSRASRSGDLEQVLRADTPLRTRLDSAQWTAAQARELRDDIVASHCGMLPEKVVPRLVLAQRMRDAAMAQALADDATADGAVLIAGNGHVRADLGVPVYLRAGKPPDAQWRIVTVGYLEVNAGDEDAADFPQAIVADHPGFDYLWLTPSIPRPDPCAAFRSVPKG